AAIESLTTGRRTAIGSGILKAIDAIAQVDQSVAPSYTEGDPGPAPTPVPQGDYAPDIIVLLTDGVSNAGPLPLDAAQQAADRGVRVYTIGYGTPNGSIPFDNGGGFGFNNGPQFGFGPQFGGGFRTGIDETTLKAIASMTGGQYYTAASADELENVFKSLPTYLITKHEILELSVAFAAFGALMATIAILLSLRWNPLP
ncbi:MAG TPA: VWA domain-containing protein, partial [Candidatus Acidoferrum sp.]|nr:VWA domain-containing protein [Candidatus Acidoferrum sp.]